MFNGRGSLILPDDNQQPQAEMTTSIKRYNSQMIVFCNFVEDHKQWEESRVSVYIFYFPQPKLLVFFFFLWWDPVRSRTPSITVGSKSKINMCSDAIRQSSFYIQCSAKGYIASISPLCLWLSKWIINNCLQLKAALKFTSRPRGWHFTLFLPRLLVTHAKSIVSMRWWDLLL